VRQISLDGDSSVTRKYRVWRNPTFIYVINGREVRRSSGLRSVDDLKQMYRRPWF
jgi:hypothetical protein